ncbi:MAG TPA: hypothetical protein VGG16_11165 [Streptosporangiaceae bacterium]|jgi:hypothetical protein
MLRLVAEAGSHVVRADSAGSTALTEREQLYLIASSKPYLFHGEGTAHLSGIEYVSAAPPRATAAIRIPQGRYAVTIHPIDSAASARDASGEPGQDALPDVVVLVSPAPEEGSFRTAARTFGTTAGTDVISDTLRYGVP